jgi:hypothetical protein
MTLSTGRIKWWHVGLLLATLPTLFVLAVVAERESRAKETRRRVARLSERETIG